MHSTRRVHSRGAWYFDGGQPAEVNLRFTRQCPPLTSTFSSPDPAHSRPPRWEKALVQFHIGAATTLPGSRDRGYFASPRTISYTAAYTGIHVQVGFIRKSCLVGHSRCSHNKSRRTHTDTPPRQPSLSCNRVS